MDNLIALLAFSVATYGMTPMPATSGNTVVYLAATGCTRDAKQCPDGSYVGRIPPSCEFAPCPASSNRNRAIMDGVSRCSPGLRWCLPND